MNSLISWVAQYLLFVMVAAVAVLVLTAPPALRWRTIAAGVLGLGLVGVFIVTAAAIHTDPRPFVVDPSVHPLFHHAADNGFPSDHSAAAGLLTAIAWRVRRLGAVLIGIAAAAVAATRVLAHVHHVQDVIAGLLLGALAGLIAIVVVDWIAPRITARRSRAASPAADQPGLSQHP